MTRKGKWVLAAALGILFWDCVVLVVVSGYWPYAVLTAIVTIFATVEALAVARDSPEGAEAVANVMAGAGLALAYVIGAF